MLDRGCRRRIRVVVVETAALDQLQERRRQRAGGRVPLGRVEPARLAGEAAAALAATPRERGTQEVEPDLEALRHDLVLISMHRCTLKQFEHDALDEWPQRACVGHTHRPCRPAVRLSQRRHRERTGDLNTLPRLLLPHAL
eukprot:2486181-Pleurochrysis_carterae.AAC.5